MMTSEDIRRIREDLDFEEEDKSFKKNTLAFILIYVAAFLTLGALLTC